MDVTIVASTLETAYIIKNLYPLYLHDLSEFSGELPNEHGVIEPTPVRTLVEQADVQNVWWTRPGVLFPLLIRVDVRPAGFCMVAAAPHVPEDIEYDMKEFFLLRPYRGRGIGRSAAVQALDRFRGRWEVQVLPANVPAQRFWMRTIGDYTSGRFRQSLEQCAGSAMEVFRFENGTPGRA
jgi:predicted acetyltransferase